MASKLLKLKLWDDDHGGRVNKRLQCLGPQAISSRTLIFITQWKKSVQDINGEVLCVSQFTLYAGTKRGNKPDFHKSAGGAKAKELYDSFLLKTSELYDSSKVKDGVFQAMMDVALVNDGPVGRTSYPRVSDARDPPRSNRFRG